MKVRSDPREILAQIRRKQAQMRMKQPLKEEKVMREEQL